MPAELGRPEVAGLVDALRDFNVKSEAAFLELGQVLGSLASGARTLARCGAEMAGDGGAERFLRSARGLEELVAELQRIRGDSEGRGESLARIGALARGFRRPAREFARANRTFRLLGLYMRVEASRLKEAEAEFQALSEDIQALAAGIDECAEELDERARRSAEELEAGRLRIEAVRQEQSAESGQMLAVAGEELASAQTGGQRSEAAARQLAQGCTDVRDELNRLVMSLQFQDIARQRLEHVCEGLQQVSEALEGGAVQGGTVQGGTVQGGTVGAEGAAGLAVLQSRQLGGTKRELASVLGRITANLGEVRQKLSQLQVEATRLIEDTPDGKGRRERMRRLAKLCGESTERLHGVVAEVAPALQSMGASADRIDETGYRIGMVALNCAVKTERLGGSGAALGVVARELSRLALETESHAETVVAQLGELKRETASLPELGGGLGEGELELHAMRTVDEAEAAQAEYLQRLRMVGEVTSKLLSELEKAVAGQGWAAELLRGLDEAEQGLARLCSGLGSAAGGGTGEAVRWSEELENRYTMASERSIHNEYLSGYEKSPEGEEKEKDDNFDGEIELF